MKNENEVNENLRNQTNLNDFEFTYDWDGYRIVAYKGNDEEIFIPVMIPKLGKTKMIGNDAFKGNKSIRKVIIPKNIIRIGVSSFENCDNLEEVIIEGRISKIPQKAFKNCKKLKKISLSKNLSIVKKEAFKNCLALEDIKLSDDVAFDYSSFENTKFFEKKNMSNYIYQKNIFNAIENHDEQKIEDNIIFIGKINFNYTSTDAKSGLTPLTWALKCKEYKCARKLIDLGATFNQSIYKEDLHFGRIFVNSSKKILDLSFIDSIYELKEVLKLGYFFGSSKKESDAVIDIIDKSSDYNGFIPRFDDIELIKVLKDKSFPLKNLTPKIIVSTTSIKSHNFDELNFLIENGFNIEYPDRNNNLEIFDYLTSKRVIPSKDRILSAWENFNLEEMLIFLKI